jgi:hypothetical protein
MEKTMKTLIAVVSLALAGFAVSAPAADAAASAPEKGKSAQNNKMKTCSADFKATGKPSAERQAFMKECLSAKAPAAAASGTDQQNKMKTCNADAKGKTGDERKAFMKECLSK